MTRARMSRLPLVISLVPERFEDGGFSGVPRFDFELRRALPGLVSKNTRWPTLLWLRWLALRRPDAIVITGNETSLLVPEPLRTIVVHHGSAQTHFDRDPSWRGKKEQALCAAQARMYERPRRWFVALAQWTAEQFASHYNVPKARVIPNWVDMPVRPLRALPSRPVVLGDWRLFNKGSDVIARLSDQMPGVEFRPLKCTFATRREAYHAADAYLCLSLSEGGSYSVSDAEAAQLPLITTDVGNYFEYQAAHVIPWQQRDDVQHVSQVLEAALATPRSAAFFDSWTLTEWQAAWRALVEEVAASER